MKKIIVALSVVILFSLYFVDNTAAQSFDTGTLVTGDQTPAVYYIGSDGRKYMFPDEQTYRSWYNDFSRVQVLPQRTVDQIASGGSAVTVRPGTKLVKFRNDARVYAVDTGAVLRWIPNEEAAGNVYGPNWAKSVVEFPINTRDAYKIGNAINEGVTYIRDSVRSIARAVENELRARTAVIQQTREQQRSIAEDQKPRLTHLFSDYRFRLEPNFVETFTSYRLGLPSYIHTLTVRPRANNPKAIITINGARVDSNSRLAFNLESGINRIVARVTDPDTNEFTDYTLIAFRDSASNIAALESLTTGNIVHQFDPPFRPGIYEYDLEAGFSQDFWRFTPTVLEDGSRITVDGIAVVSGREHSVPISKGPNVVNIVVTADNGRTQAYKINVNRDRFARIDATELSVLRVDLQAPLEPAFDPNQTIYHTRAGVDEGIVLIEAFSKFNDVFVTIDGEQANSKYIRLSEGENEIEITTQFESEVRTYELNIYKQPDNSL